MVGRVPLIFRGRDGRVEVAKGLVVSKLVGVANGEVCLEPFLLEVLRLGKIVGPGGVLGPDRCEGSE
jgi:hypothetical protein